MVLIDWIIAAILVVSVVGAARKGFVVEAFSLAGVVLSLLLASWNYKALTPRVSEWIHQPMIASAVSFLAIALGVMIVAGIAGRLARSSVKSLGLGFADRLLGAIFGFVKGCVLVTIGIIALAAFFPRTTWLRDSCLAPYFLSMAHTTTAVTPSDLGARIRSGVTIIRDAQPIWLRPNANGIPRALQSDKITTRTTNRAWIERGICEA
jgi:membrane protein required for colicin V production